MLCIATRMIFLHVKGSFDTHFSVSATGKNKSLERLLDNEKTNFKILAEKVSIYTYMYMCICSTLSRNLCNLGIPRMRATRNLGIYHCSHCMQLITHIKGCMAYACV